MAMGSADAVNMTAKHMSDIKAAVEEYRGKANALAGELESTINGLIPSSFDGAAANGFKAFYTKTFTSEDGVNPGLTNLLNVIDSMADEILKSIPGADGLDDKLGEGNNQ